MFAYPAQRVVLQEALHALTAADGRLEAALVVPSWKVALVVAAFRAMRGIEFGDDCRRGP
jgi:hypothetical protein